MFNDYENKAAKGGTENFFIIKCMFLVFTITTWKQGLNNNIVKSIISKTKYRKLVWWEILDTFWQISHEVLIEVMLLGKPSKNKKSKTWNIYQNLSWPLPPLKIWDTLYGILRNWNIFRWPNKVVGTWDLLLQTLRPPVWQISQVLHFLFFEGFP